MKVRVTFIFIISLIILFASQGFAEISKPIPNTLPLSKKLSVNGYFAIGTSLNGEEIYGYVLLKYRGVPFNKATVTLGGIPVPQNGGAGHYSFENLNIPINNQPVKLRIIYASFHPGKKEVITINGIVAGPYLRIIRPDSDHFNPFVSLTYKVSWSEMFGKIIFYINNLTDGNTIINNNNVNAVNINLNSSLFKVGKVYKFYVHARKNLKIKGPITSGSGFYFEKQAVARTTSFKLIKLPVKK